MPSKKIIIINPDIRACPWEVHFFNRDENYKQGLEWYRSHMPESREDQLPENLLATSPQTVPRSVYKWSRDVKL